jgi:AbiV family abortive infection protein
MNPNTAHRLATASLTNALEFEAQATLCFDRRWFGRACSLAILGQEEAGKAIYFFQVAIGALRLKPDAVKVLFRKHVPKQQLGQAPVVAGASFNWGAMVSAFRAAVQPLVDADASSLDALPAATFDELLRRSLDGFERAVESDPAGRAEFVKVMRGVVSGLAEIDLDGLKQSGLYVDYNEKSGVVSAPQEIVEEAARAQLRMLKEVAEMLTTMLDAVPADAVERMRAILEPRIAEGAMKQRERGSARPTPEGERPPSG